MRSTTNKNIQTEKLPPSSVLAQVKSFLPLLKAANEKLEDTDTQNLGLQEPASSPYVEMVNMV